MVWQAQAYRCRKGGGAVNIVLRHYIYIGRLGGDLQGRKAPGGAKKGICRRLLRRQSSIPADEMITPGTGHHETLGTEQMEGPKSRQQMN